MAAGTPRKDNYPVYNNNYYNRQSEFYKMECIRSNLKKKITDMEAHFIEKDGSGKVIFSTLTWH